MAKLILLLLTACVTIEALLRVALNKTIHGRSSYKPKAIAEYLKQKYIKGYKPRSGHAFNEELSNYLDFDCQQSSTCTQTSRPFSITYGRGSMQGYVIKDVVCFGTYQEYCTNNQQGLACAVYQPGNTFVDSPYDGVLGMAWDSLSKGIPQPMSQIFGNKELCPEDLFAFWLNRDLYHNDVGGEMTLCGIDHSHYKGTMTWLPLVAEDYWRIKLNGLNVGGYSIITRAVDAAVDTGSSSIVGPPQAIQTIHKLIGASDDLAIDCSTIPDLPAISFKFGDVEFVLRGSDYVIQRTDGTCMSGFYGLDLHGVSWIIGDTFIGTYYTVFDHTNKRVGFAKAARRHIHSHG